MKVSKIESNLIHMSFPNELFLDHVPLLKEKILTELNEETEVIFDFSNIEYVDSTGIEFLVAISQRIKCAKIKGIHDPVKELFELTKLDQLFEYID